MVEVTSIRFSKGGTVGELARAMDSAFRRAGFISYATVKSSTRITYTLTNDISKRGYRWSASSQAYTGKKRRTRNLSWDDWVEANNLINDVFDKLGVSANIRSLGGKFIIRSGTRRGTLSDWESREYENVGSIMNPIARADYITKED